MSAQTVRPTRDEIIWKLPVRIIHVALAVCVILNLFILEEGDLPHNIVGYTAVGLVFLRTLIGFWGLPPRNSSFKNAELFKNFPMRLTELIHFFKNPRHPAEKYFGHNPPASYSSVGLWCLIILLGISGWMQDLDAFFGEDWVKSVHEVLANLVMVFIGVHLLGILIDSIQFKRKTWMGMISGKRPQFKQKRY